MIVVFIEINKNKMHSITEPNTEIATFVHKLNIESKFLGHDIQNHIERKVLSEDLRRQEPVIRIRKVTLRSIQITNDQSNIATVEIQADCVKPTNGRVFTGKIETLIRSPGLAVVLIEEKVSVFVKHPPESLSVGDLVKIKIINQRFTKGNLKLMGTFDI